MMRPLAVLLCALFLSGCAATSGPPGPLYPADLRQSETLNVQVFRFTKHVELTNTTARSFGPSRLWLNARFSRTLDPLAAGESLRLPLQDFTDEHGDVFRGGGFFAREIPERLVLAQLELPGADGKPVMLGLVVVKGEDE